MSWLLWAWGTFALEWPFLLKSTKITFHNWVGTKVNVIQAEFFFTRYYYINVFLLISKEIQTLAWAPNCLVGPCPAPAVPKGISALEGVDRGPTSRTESVEGSNLYHLPLLGSLCRTMSPS